MITGVTGNQGNVITRSPSESLQLRTLEVSADKPTFLLQTNYDHWNELPAADDRRNPGIYCMNKSPSISFSALFNVLTCNKVLIQEAVLTALMDAKSGKMEVYLRKCPEGGCDPGPEVLARNEL